MAGSCRPGSAYGRAGPAEIGLSGTGLLADDLWLAAHHEVTGRPLLHARPLRLGLAAGLLAELMTAQHPAIMVWHDGVITIGEGVSRRAVEGHPLLRQIAAEQQALPVRDWLMYVSRTADDDVGRRLERAGYVTRCRRRFPGLPARLVPVERDWAFAPITRVGAALRGPSGVYGVVLAGLAVACGLGFRLDLYLTGTEAAAGAAVACLPDGLQLLISQTQTAVSAAVLSRT